MPVCLPGLSPESYRPHALHAPDRCWPETNCILDVWIELLSTLGLPPEAALGVTARQDFEADQFGFTKLSAIELNQLFGLKLQELSIYERTALHVERQISRGRLCFVEVDPFLLPDTGHAAYRRLHGKTTIGINNIDLGAGRIEYFHNGGYFALEMEDLDELLSPRMADGTTWRPYAEFTTVEPERVDTDELRARSKKLLQASWNRRPADNPIRRFQAVLPEQAYDLVGRGEQAFHDYAFHNLRVLGSNFELLAACLDWLACGEDPRSVDCGVIASTAKQASMMLARAVARGRVDGLAACLEPAAEAWEAVFQSPTVRAAA